MESLLGHSTPSLNKVRLYIRENRNYKYEIPQLSPHPLFPKSIHKSIYLIHFSKEAMALLFSIRNLTKSILLYQLSPFLYFKSPTLPWNKSAITKIKNLKQQQKSLQIISPFFSFFSRINLKKHTLFNLSQIDCPDYC